MNISKLAKSIISNFLNISDKDFHTEFKFHDINSVSTFVKIYSCLKESLSVYQVV